MAIEPVASSSVHLVSQRKSESDVRSQHREPHQQPAEQRLSSPLLELTKEDLEKTIKGLNAFLEAVHNAPRFVLQQGEDSYAVVLVDGETEEVIREIPPDKLADLYVSMLEPVGLLINEQI